MGIVTIKQFKKFDYLIQKHVCPFPFYAYCGNEDPQFIIHLFGHVPLELQCPHCPSNTNKRLKLAMHLKVRAINRIQGCQMASAIYITALTRELNKSEPALLGPLEFELTDFTGA